MSLSRVGGLVLICTAICISSIQLCQCLTSSAGEALLRHTRAEISQRCLQTDWPLFCYIHLKPRQPSLGQNCSLINTFHRVNGALASPPAWGSSQSHGPCSVPRRSPAWRQCQCLTAMPTPPPSHLNPDMCRLPAPPSPPATSFSPSPARISMAQGTVLRHLIYFSSFRQNDGLTLENPLGKGWAILHFRQACPGDFESSH